MKNLYFITDALASFRNTNILADPIYTKTLAIIESRNVIHSDEAFNFIDELSRHNRENPLVQRIYSEVIKKTLSPPMSLIQTCLAFSKEINDPTVKEKVLKKFVKDYQTISAKEASTFFQDCLENVSELSQEEKDCVDLVFNDIQADPRKYLNVEGYVKLVDFIEKFNYIKPQLLIEISQNFKNILDEIDREKKYNMIRQIYRNTVRLLKANKRMKQFETDLISSIPEWKKNCSPELFLHLGTVLSEKDCYKAEIWRILWPVIESLNIENDNEYIQQIVKNISQKGIIPANSKYKKL